MDPWPAAQLQDPTKLVKELVQFGAAAPDAAVSFCRRNVTSEEWEAIGVMLVVDIVPEVAREVPVTVTVQLVPLANELQLSDKALSPEFVVENEIESMSYPELFVTVHEASGVSELQDQFPQLKLIFF